MNRRVLVASLAALAALAYVGWRLANADGDPVALFELGSQYSEGLLDGSEGYDGQFTFAIAHELDPATVGPKLDVPAYRYQRILLPLLGRIAGLVDPAWTPWALIAVTLAGHWLGTWAVAGLLENRGASAWFGLSYGLWVGLIAPAGIGLSEPLAYGLAALGLLLAVDRRRLLLGPALLVLAGFAKETTLIFPAALILTELSGKRDRRMLAAAGVAVALHILWQFWLLAAFGAFGIGSGGAMATQFELLPFMGLLRTAGFGLEVLLFFLALALPVVLAATWGVLRSLRDWWRGERSFEVYALLANGLAIMALPFSTFREPLGLVRVADGLVLAVLMHAARYDIKRPLRYSLFGIAWLVIVLSH